MGKKMNERIQKLAEQAAGNFTENFKWDYLPEIDKDIFEKFAELLKQALYDEIKEELVPEEHIDAELDIEDRCYLRGNNGGIIDALTIIKNFGVNIDD
jgi:hypothetical protein